MSKPFVDFYKANNISPVAQDISDLQAHFDRRGALFRQMGIVPSSIRGKSVIEFGPGSGFNSIFTNSLGPSRYLLVDGNPTGVARTRELLQQYAGTNCNFVVVESLIEEFQSAERSDFVFCEGVIPNQSNPINFLRHVASFVAPGGVLFVSCADSISCLADYLRRILALLVGSGVTDLKDRVTLLTEYFRPHLLSMKGMSRKHEDWVWDNIAHPLNNLGPLMSVKDAITGLASEFDFYGGSPDYFVDWRWYKDLVGADRQFNERAISSYQSNLHNFLDYRHIAAPRPLETNMELRKYCDQVRVLLMQYERDTSPESLSEIVRVLAAVSASIEGILPATGAAIEDFCSAVKAFKYGSKVPDVPNFSPWFGRAQQCISFIRK